MKKFWITLLIIIASLSLMAFLLGDDLPERVDQLIAGIVTFLIMLFGPKPLKILFDALGIPGGSWRLVATYAVSLIVGLVALVIAGAITSLPTTIDDVLALGGLLMAVVNAAYHRLKDLQAI